MLVTAVSKTKNQKETRREMSFIERRISEYKTAPDARRVKQLQGGGEGRTRRTSSPLTRTTSKTSVSNSAIPVLERKKMFEQTDSTYQTASFGGSVSGRRGSKMRKEVSRNSSFRGTKRLKSEDAHSPVMGRAKQICFSNTSIPLWKKLRNFGHFDIQSLAKDRFSINPGSTEAEPNIKKPTGASAAHGDSETVGSSGISNCLVSNCTAFTNEIGGDSDWLSPGDPILILRESLSVDKQRRVGSREKMIIDGEIPSKSMVITRGPMNRHVSSVLSPKTGPSYPFEFIDIGATYYRNYFLQNFNEHQNFFGVDENLGPIAISIQREKVPEQLADFYGIQLNPSQIPPRHLYRVIFRTSELCTLRGTLLEESIPTGAKTGTSRAIPPRDIVEYITQGEVQMSCLKLGRSDKKVLHELVRLDEQELSNKYKVGIIYCKEGQETEEDMYNNESGSPALDEFLELIGEKVRMKGFSKYRAQLDNKTDTTGEYSVYTDYRDAEIMFHVSTLLPHTASNKQQLLRKRHIGNDIVTIIFQEAGCKQFSPKCIRSHFQHIFIIVRVENPNTPYTKYKIAVSRSTDIPFFGPPIPEGAVFDKNDNFREFLLSKLINACNASLRNKKFSNMAVRTRRQYLNDLAEQSSTAITIDQANTSGRVAGLLRNLGHKKKERSRQDSALIYTNGGLTWHVSILLRNKKPLPFSEEHDNHIECIMGIGPDIIVFLDYYTKNTLLHIPTKDLSGWIVDNSRINLFYENCYCLCLDCHESEEELKEMITRMQSVAPRLTASHEAFLMEFKRGPSGFLGFTINEAGVVEKVDGLARISGLQSNSRLLQVEDRLVCCHSHKQITDLLTAKNKLSVRAYVIPPPPKPRPQLFYPEINWSGIWSSRPTHGDLEESLKVQNGMENSESLENSGKEEILDSNLNLKKKKKKAHSNRYSYMEAMQSSEIESLLDPIDDDEPIYDRLLADKVASTHDHKSGVPKSPLPTQKKQSSLYYRRFKGSNKSTTRESVMHLADDLKERNFTQSLPYSLTPMEHTVSEVELNSPVQLTSSVQMPDRKPHVAGPLTSQHKRSNSRELKKKPSIEVTSPKTPRGTVSRMTRIFSFNSPPSTGIQSTKIPTSSRHGNSPMKALASTSEMTKSNIPIKGDNDDDAKISQNDSKDNSVSNNIRMRSGERSKTRPASFDVSLLLNNEKNIETSSILRGDMNSKDDSFLCNTQAQGAFQRESQSRELDDVEAMEPSSESVPPSPTTGALISEDENETMSIPEDKEMMNTLSTEEKTASQNTGSQSSQESIRNLKMTVRERTKKWEERGGGLPSYFSTLPKSFRHKATDRRRDPAHLYNPHSPTGETTFYYIEDEEEMMRIISSNTSTGSSRGGSQIPLPTSKLRSPRTSVTGSTPTPPTSVTGTRLNRGRGTRDKSFSPGKDDDNSLTRSLNSSGHSPSSNESSLERRVEDQQSVEKRQGFMAGKSKKGNSLLPVRNQVSSRRTGQHVAPNGGGERVGSSTSGDSGGYSESNKPRKSSLIPPSTSSSSSSSHPPKHSNTSHQRLPSSKPPSGRTSLVNPSTRLKSPPPYENYPSLEHHPSLEHQESIDSLANNLNELDKNLKELLSLESKEQSDGNSHIVEWIKQTSKDAVPPDEQNLVLPSRDNISSPTFTDNSLTYSQTSECSQEVVDSLKSKLQYLETLLTKESENSNDLLIKLEKTENKLEEVLKQKQNKASQITTL